MQKKLGSKINILLQKMALNLERNENYAPESKMGCNLGPWRVVFANIYMPLTSRICTQQTLKLLTIEQTNINFLLARNSNSPCHFRNRFDGWNLRKMQSKSWDLGLFGILWCWPWINSYFKYQTNCLYTLARNANANVPLQYDISHTWCPHPPTTTTQHLPWLFRDQGVKII